MSEAQTLAIVAIVLAIVAIGVNMFSLYAGVRARRP